MSTFGPQDITNTADDGYSNGSTWIPSLYGSLSVTRNLDYAGMRWRNITIPQGATINSASIQFNAVASSANPVVDVKGDNVDNAGIWDATHRPDNNIAPTSASASVHVTANGSYSIDVTTIVQEIVNRGGWSSGNSMRFALTTNTLYSNVTITDLDGAGDTATFTVDYTAGGGTNVFPALALGFGPSLIVA